MQEGEIWIELTKGLIFTLATQRIESPGWMDFLNHLWCTVSFRWMTDFCWVSTNQEYTVSIQLTEPLKIPEGPGTGVSNFNGRSFLGAKCRSGLEV
jgi:hypothetical protein